MKWPSSSRAGLATGFAGRRLGRWRIRELLGAGGMGAVYRATSGSEQVALKVVHPHWAHDEEFRRRFRREAAIAHLVRGPGVAAFVDANLDDEVPWLASELVRGPTLEQVVGVVGPLPADPLRELASITAQTLASMAAQGVVHRDIKPANVILASRGPVLVDFGIAAATELTAMTRAGAVLGSPGWMAPEQVSGMQTGPAADVFSWAATVAFAATARLPFGVGSFEVLSHRIRNEPPDLEGIAEDLQHVLTAALAKDPTARPSPQRIIARMPSGAGETQPLGLQVPTLVELAAATTVSASEDDVLPAQIATRRSTGPLTAATLLGAASALVLAGVILGQGKEPTPATPSTTASGIPQVGESSSLPPADLEAMPSPPSDRAERYRNGESDRPRSSDSLRIGDTADLSHFSTTVSEKRAAGGVWGVDVTVCYERPHAEANPDGSTRVSRDPWSFGVQMSSGTTWVRAADRDSVVAWSPSYRENLLELGECQTGWIAASRLGREPDFVGMRYAPSDFPQDLTTWRW